MPKSKTSCVVELLDGSDFIVDNKRLQEPEDLLNHVCEHIGVAERDYFGLKYTNCKDGKISWLDGNEPLMKQFRKAYRHRFKLGIQFFPDTIHVLQDEVTRYQFVLQTRENLLTGRWSCSMPTQALLASYIVQAEFGNYDPSKHQADYLNDLQFVCVQNENFVEKVCLFHKNHKGISPSDADWLYMKTAGKMVMYGMEVYDVRDGDGNILTFGIDVYGIHILFLNTVLHSFVWPLVTKVTCVGKELLITINVSSNDQAESINIGFILMTERDTKRVAKSCTQHKEFHRSGAVKKSVKKPNKTVPCTHISTRVLPKDFKRVDSFEYSKLFERVLDAHNTSHRDSDDTSERIDSMDEGSTSKDTTASNSDELNQSSLSENHLECDMNNENDLGVEKVAHIDLTTAEEKTCEENANYDEDSPPHITHPHTATDKEPLLSSDAVLDTGSLPMERELPDEGLDLQHDYENTTVDSNIEIDVADSAMTNHGAESNVENDNVVDSNCSGTVITDHNNENSIIENVITDNSNENLINSVENNIENSIKSIKHDGNDIVERENESSSCVAMMIMVDNENDTTKVSVSEDTVVDTLKMKNEEDEISHSDEQPVITSEPVIAELADGNITVCEEAVEQSKQINEDVTTVDTQVSDNNDDMTPEPVHSDNFVASLPPVSTHMEIKPITTDNGVDVDLLLIEEYDIIDC